MAFRAIRGLCGIGVLHDHVTAFLHGQSKKKIRKKDIQRTNILRLSSSKAPSKCKHYLLMPYNVNDVLNRASRDDNGNVTFMAQGAKQDCF